MNQSILAIVGPTAAGKTEFGLRLAREQNGEIISVDSRQVYKYLQVGTAKPIGNRRHPDESRGPVRDDIFRVDSIPYHLIDFLDPAKLFSAADFVKLSVEKVQDIRARGKIPIFVGGTGLYFKALTEGLANLPPANAEIRDRLKNEATEIGRSALHQRLAAIDPEAANKIPANNIQRLIRALEVYEITGKPISEWHKEHQDAVTSPKDVPPLNFQFIGLDPGREELGRRIESRCRLMLENGMIDETQALLDRGYKEVCPALTGLGYPRIIAVLKGKLSKIECVRLLIQDTRQYAKRQRTWFRHQLPVEWKEF